MKKILFLLFFPCLALAQYQGNANQKITLGEQTTADGLVWRGLRADTTSKIVPFSDTSAYIILDTVEKTLWLYKAGQVPKWQQVGGSSGVSVSSFSAGTTGLTPSTATTGAVTLGGTLAVANGGTGTTSLSPNNYLIRTNSSGIFDTSVIYEAGGKVGIGTNNPGSNLQVGINNNTTNEVLRLGVSYGVTNEERGILSWHDNGGITGKIFTTFNGVDMTKMHFGGLYNNAYNQGINLTIQGNGNIGIGTASPAVQFHTTGGVRFAGLASITDLRTDADGDLFNGSDFNLKNSIDTINFGLSDVLKLKPVSFNWNDESRNISEYKSMGFIAQDVMDVIPNAASSMGDGDMQVDYNAIVATLTKAIQEQQALIKALEQRILILENK